MYILIYGNKKLSLFILFSFAFHFHLKDTQKRELKSIMVIFKLCMKCLRSFLNTWYGSDFISSLLRTLIFDGNVVHIIHHDQSLHLYLDLFCTYFTRHDNSKCNEDTKRKSSQKTPPITKKTSSSVTFPNDHNTNDIKKLRGTKKSYLEDILIE